MLTNKSTHCTSYGLHPLMTPKRTDVDSFIWVSDKNQSISIKAVRSCYIINLHNNVTKPCKKAVQRVLLIFLDNKKQTTAWHNNEKTNNILFVENKTNSLFTKWVNFKVGKVQITINFVERCDKFKNSSANKIYIWTAKSVLWLAGAVS